MHKNRSLIIWDSEDTPPNDVEYRILWQGHVSGNLDNEISITQLVEDNAEKLKSRYLTFIYELGKKIINGKCVTKHLQLRYDFSYWWMTLLSEKCNYDKSPQIENAIKLFALEDWIAEQVHEIGSIKLVSSNLLLSECLMDWCRRESIFFEWEKLNKNNPLKNFFYSTFPHSVKAMVWLVSYVAKYSFLRGVGVDEWKKTKNSLTIFTYTANPISEDVENNSCNRYWTKLPEELYRNNVTINWMYIHVRDSSFTKTKNIIKTFKKNNSGDNVYTILDGFISFSVIFKSIFVTTL